MADKKCKEISIIEVREISRNLGMSRGRITRNIHAGKVCDIRQFQLSFLLKAEDEAKEQREYARMLFSRF